MKKIKIILLIYLTTILACSNKHFVSTPDEFKIVNNSPLSIPPFYQINDPNDAIINDKRNLFIQNKDKIDKLAPTSQGEELLLNKIAIQNDESESILMDKQKTTNNGFFNKLFKKENNYAKDSTQNPAADESTRTYKSESMQLMKAGPKNNGRICNISNGEIIYCDKNSFMKNFTFKAD